MKKGRKQGDTLCAFPNCHAKATRMIIAPVTTGSFQIPRCDVHASPNDSYMEVVQ